ncbi:MAG: hypothetical protein K0U79_05635, partial [Gammaproteobacteria bacterium]|nr:hypothetical protein [Gammaproteobacteria bacterium]
AQRFSSTALRPNRRRNMSDADATGRKVGCSALLGAAADCFERDGHLIYADQVRLAQREIERLHGLISDALPEMEARTQGLRETWPAREILTALHRNERITADMRAVVSPNAY